MSRRTIICTAFVVLVNLPLTINGQSIEIDDFNDGNDEGWIHVDLTQGQPGGPGIYDASSGAYNLRTTGVVPADAFGIVSSFWEGSFDPLFSDGALRATVRAENVGTSNALLMRFEPSNLAGYIFGIDSPGHSGPDSDDFFFTVASGPQILRNETFHLPDFVPSDGEDWVIEASAIDDEITMKVWPSSQPEPDAPQLTLTDSTFSTGLIGLGASRDPGSLFEPWQLNGTYDDVSFTPAGLPPGILDNPGLVNPGLDGNLPPGLRDGLPMQSHHSVPEPASAILVLLGSGICCLLRRRRIRCPLR